MLVVAAYLIPTALPALPRSVSAERGVRLTLHRRRGRGVVRARNPLPPVLRESTRARRGDIVPFIKNDMPVQAKGSIVEIVVGPSAATGSETGLPIGVQIVGPAFEDRTTLAFAAFMEREFGGFVLAAAQGMTSLVPQSSL